MNKKEVIIILAALAILVGFGVMLSKKKNDNWAQAGGSIGDKVFPGLEESINDINTVVLKDSETEVVLNKKEGNWVVSSKYDYPADWSKLKQFVMDLRELKIVQAVNAGESQYGRLELVAPAEGAEEAGTKVELKADDSTKAGLIIGKDHTGPSQGGRPGYPDGKYIRNLEDNSISLVSETFYAARSDASSWFKKDFLKIQNPINAELRKEGNVIWKLEADDSNMVLTDLNKETEEMETSKANGVKGAFSYANFADIADPALSAEETGLDKPSLFIAEDKDGFVYTVKIGKKDDNSQYHVQATVEYAGPESRATTEDESDEDKQTKDEEFAAKRNENLEKAKAINERLNKWTYLVASHTVDKVLLERSDLVKEKEEESEESDSAATPPSVPPAGVPVLPAQ